ncbi:hypothetical protein GCM10023067_47510 [Aminobacter aganoensis]
MVAGAVDVAEIVAVAVVGDGAELLVYHQFGEADDGVERRGISWLMRARKSVFCDDERSAWARAWVSSSSARFHW